MSRFFFKISYRYSIEALEKVRFITSSKTCYRKHLSFLKFRTNLTNSISNRFAYKSNFYRSYLDLRRYYIFFMRSNFTNNGYTLYPNYFSSGMENRRFMAAFVKSNFMKELDYALLWRGVQTNSLFNLSVKITKKKKKLIYTKRVFFISPGKRLLFVWKWLNVFTRILATKGVPRRLILIKSLENFLMTTDKYQVINDFKLQIYKLKLLRTE